MLLNIHKITDVICLEELSLFRAAVTPSARTRIFYGNMWNGILENKLYKGKSLLHRVLETSIFYDISLVRFVCDAKYANASKIKE